MTIGLGAPTMKPVQRPTGSSGGTDVQWKGWFDQVQQKLDVAAAVANAYASYYNASTRSTSGVINWNSSSVTAVGGSIVSGTFTTTTGGLFLIKATATVTSAVSAGGMATPDSLRIYLNGVDVGAHNDVSQNNPPGASQADFCLALDMLLRLAAGDTIAAFYVEGGGGGSTAQALVAGTGTFVLLQVGA